MKKKSASRSAFSKLSILVGLIVFLAGVFLALGRGALNPNSFGNQLTNQAPFPSGPQILVPAVGPVVVTATAGDTGPTSYATLKAAFDAINAGIPQGVINVAIVGDTTETASAVLNASGGPSSYTSILIQPSGGAARSISGAIGSNRPLIDLNGATNITIDGIGTGGNALTLSNTTASNTASTIRFINGAQNDTVTRSSVLGSSTSALTSPGGNILFSTTTGASNNNNTVSFCNIGPAGANLPTKAVMGLGSAGNPNTGNLIDNNNIFDFFNASTSISGINLQDNNDNWTISNNRIYQTAARTFTSPARRYTGITLNAGTGAFTITGNIIGFGAANGTGTTAISGSTNEFRGLDLANVSTATPTSVQGNTISGVNQTSGRNSTTISSTVFGGIALGSTDGRFNVGDVTGNTIGSLDGSSSIAITGTSTVAGTAPAMGILHFSSQSDTISNNAIGNISINSGGVGTTVGFSGIFSVAATSQVTTVNNNTIANVTDNIVGNYATNGISSASAVSATGNLVRNMSGNANGSGVTMSGIIVSAGTATQPSTISQNTVHSLSNTVTGGSAGTVDGMDVTLPALSNVIERNFVHSLNVTSSLTANQIWGMAMRGQGTATFQNNIVQLGLDAAGNSITAGFQITGIRDIAGATANYYFNSVYIGGSGVVLSIKHFCL
jgi:hypothetical protein